MQKKSDFFGDGILERLLILITNDDGINSPGILAAAEAVEDLGDILIVAPQKQQSGMGRAFLRQEETGKIEQVELKGEKKCFKGYGVYGTPAFSVAHAVLELSDRKPSLCISGINYGENLGTVLTCSGTVGAAFEAATYGIPAIAVSLEAQIGVQRLERLKKMDFTNTQKVLREWTKRILRSGMKKGVDILNINVPNETLNKMDKWKWTVQSRQNYFEFLKPEKRDFSKAYALQTVRKVKKDSLEKNSDIYAVYVERIISVTPLSINMTAQEAILEL